MAGMFELNASQVKSSGGISHVASLNCLITCIDLKSSTQEKILKDFLCCNINSAMIFFSKAKKKSG